MSPNLLQTISSLCGPRTLSGAGLLVTFALGLSSTACDVVVEGSGHVVSDEQHLEFFDSVSVQDSFEVRFVPADEFTVVVHADDNIIDDVRVRQEDDQVFVTLANDLNVTRATLEVDVMLPELRKLRLEDACSLVAENMPTAGSLQIEVRDASNLRFSTPQSEMIGTFELKCEDASSCDVATHAQESIVELHDASNAELRGSSERMTLLVSDASDCDADSFEVERLQVRINDASSAEVRVTDAVTGKVTDASSLEVSGGGDIDVETDDSSDVDRD